MGSENIFSNLEFSKDQMVKKVIVGRDNYKVIRINLEKGFEIPPHAGSHSVFFLVLQGKGIFKSKNGDIELSKDEYISIDADEIRGIKCIDENLVILAVRD